MSRFSHIRRLALTAFVLLSLLVMSAFPQGTMAARGAQGFEVVLCTGEGALTIVVDENGTPIEDQDERVECGWWLLGQSLCLPSSPDGYIPAAHIVQTISGVEKARVRAVRSAFHYPARAPPFV